MKNLLLILLLSTLSTAVFAQGDAKAKSVLKKVSQNLKALKSMKANFKISIKNKAGNSKGSKSGQVMMKGDKYRVKISGQDIICNAKSIWTYIKESNEVQITDFEDNDEAFSPSKLFTNFYDKEYGSKYLFSKNGITYIGLIPLKKSVQYETIVLKISDKTNTVVGGKVKDKNGNSYSYSISNYAKNPVLKDALFVFNKSRYPKVEVIDLR
jgi:outer membrane lipoprotein-sorting protein